jgi:hypothetical protein
MFIANPESGIRIFFHIQEPRGQKAPDPGSSTVVMNLRCETNSVAMFIPDPDFCPTRIQKQQQKRRKKKNLLSYLILQPKINTNLKIYNFEQLKKNFWANL